MAKKIVVSSCLLGECTKYNGGHNKDKKISRLIKDFEVIGICPEEMGGLSTPRPSAEIIGGDGYKVLEGKAIVIDNVGLDVTSFFIKGAYESLKKCIENNCDLAILKANSPSCGNNSIYDGTFTGKKIAGVGVTAALLASNNIKTYSEEDELDELFKGN